MIIKNKGLFFVAAAVVALGLLYGGESKQQNLSDESLTELNTGAFSNPNTNSIQAPIIKKKNKPFKAARLKHFVRRASKNNLTQKMAAVLSDADQNGNRAGAKAAPKAKTEKTAEQKKKEEEAKNKKIIAEKKKKEKEAAAKKALRKSHTNSFKKAKVNTGKSLSEKAIVDNFESQNFSSIVSKVPTIVEDDEENSEQITKKGAQAKNSSSKSNAKSAEKEVKSLSVFANLLAEKNFAEFEQVLKTELKEEQRIEAYNETLKALLATQNNEDYLDYDSFLTTQFRNHENAILVSKSLSKASEEAVEYSVTRVLQPLVFSWNEEQDSEQFKTIYHESVLQLITSAAANFESVANLQSSIQAKYTDLFPTSVEVAAF